MTAAQRETLKDCAIGLAIGSAYAGLLLGAIALRWGL